MPDTITDVPLRTLRPGDSFAFQGKSYVVLEHAQTRTSIATIGDGKISIYKLAMRAKVTPTGRDEAGFRLGLAELHPPITVSPGDKVRFKDNERLRNRGLAGTEAIVVSVNSKTVSLDNGWRVSPQSIEKV